MGIGEIWTLSFALMKVRGFGVPKKRGLGNFWMPNLALLKGRFSWRALGHPKKKGMGEI